MRAAYLAFVLLGDAVVLLVSPGDARSAAAFALLWLLPGVGWGYALGGRWLAGFGLGLSANVLLALLLHYLPGSLSLWPALLLFTVAALAPVAVALRRRESAPKLGLSRGMLLLLLLAALFRLPSLGYSEFQGDEGVIMMRAAAALQGDDQELFLHQKGPVEILVPMASWVLGGAIDEFWARLPFALYSILGVLAVARLGKRWFGRRAGLAAGLIMAVEGFHIAFGRIVQYQGIVVFLSVLGLLALDRFRDSERGIDLSLGAVFMAAGALAHYDAVLFLPAAVALIAPIWLRRPQSARAWRPLGVALLVGAAVLGSFYGPYAAVPTFAKTVGYVAHDRVGSGLHFHLGRAWVMTTVYNSSYFVIFLLLLVALSLLRRPRQSLATPWLLLLVPVLFYLVIVFDPRTHLYTLFPGAALLAGAGAAWLWDLLARLGRPVKAIAIAAAVGLFGLCAGYPWMVFVDHSPEYQRTYPENRSRLYWTAYDELPLYGRFGFPHRAGWQAIGKLMEQGRIEGTYASNEEQEITDWYTRQAPRTHCPGADVVILAERVQDEVPIDLVEVASEYRLAGAVQVDGEPRIRWYVRTSGEESPEPLAIDMAGIRAWRLPGEVAPPSTGGDVPADVTLGDRVRLVGFDLDTSDARPGGALSVTLYWQALVPMARNYQVFTHLYDGQMWAQHDGAPECGINPTTRWEPGQIIADPHQLEIAPDAPAGPIPLLVGMYDLITRDRLDVSDTSDNAIHLADIVIQERG